VIGTPLTKPQRLSTSSTFTWVTAQSCSSRRSRHLFCTWFTRFSLKDGSLDISFAVNRKLEPTQVYYVLHLPTHWPTGAKNGTLDRSCAKPDTMHEFEIERYWRLQSASQTIQGPQRAVSLVTPGQDHDLYRLRRYSVIRTLACLSMVKSGMTRASLSKSSYHQGPSLLSIQS
jgi:hypothetical protein